MAEKQRQRHKMRKLESISPSRMQESRVPSESRMKGIGYTIYRESERKAMFGIDIGVSEKK